MATHTVNGCKLDDGTFEFEDTETGCEGVTVTGCMVDSGEHKGEVEITHDYPEGCSVDEYACFDSVTGKWKFEVDDECCEEEGACEPTCSEEDCGCTNAPCCYAVEYMNQDTPEPVFGYVKWVEFAEGGCCWFGWVTDGEGVAPIILECNNNNDEFRWVFNTISSPSVLTCGEVGLEYVECDGDGYEVDFTCDDGGSFSCDAGSLFESVTFTPDDSCNSEFEP
jgi:hypothetical protein